MNGIQEDFTALLNYNKSTGNLPIPVLGAEMARKLLDRISSISLFAHFYALILHVKYADFTTEDLLRFAAEYNLSGINIHTDYGKNALIYKNQDELEQISKLAEELKLRIGIEISTTDQSKIRETVKIAKALNVRTIRVYSRYNGFLQDIIKKTVEDLKYASRIAEEEDLFFVLEPHEVLKSNELVDIIRKVNSPGVGLHFDFGNMINACENPMTALQTMLPYTRQVHIKDVVIIREKRGMSQRGVIDGEGDLPQSHMLFELLMSGDPDPLVHTFILEQVNGYSAPAFRFPDEGDNPCISKREPSNTSLNPALSLKENIDLEKRNAIHQINYTRGLLDQLKTIAEKILKGRK